MAATQLGSRAVEKPWGRRDFPPIYGDAGRFADPVGEIWFGGDAAAALLIKRLFTSEKLSIQVHPSDEMAQASGHARGKDEAWFVLTAEPEAVIGIGFERELSPAELREASLDGSIEDLLTWHKVSPGEFFYIPAGTVHAIGAGLSLLEIQQNVDLTYRLYDYGRPRSLQIDEGVAVSRPRPYEPPAAPQGSHQREVLVAGPKFVIERLSGAAAQQLRATPLQPVWIMPLADGCEIDGQHMAPGTVWQTDSHSEVKLGSDARLLAAYAGDQPL